MRRESLALWVWVLRKVQKSHFVLKGKMKMQQLKIKCILTGESVKPGRIFKLKCISEKVFTAMKRDLSLMISGRSFYGNLYYFKIP